SLLMSSDSPPAPGGGDGIDTNSYGPSGAGLYTTNDLWLEITDFTNHVASLVVHRPWNDTNLTHDLYFRTDLSLDSGSAFNLKWSRIQRVEPAQIHMSCRVPTLKTRFSMQTFPRG